MRGRVVDWEAVRERVASAARALERGFSPDPDELNRVLVERARAAARTAVPPPATEPLEVSAFELAGETHAIETAYVREVAPLKELCPLPGTPPFLAGVMCLRGRVLAVVDLRRFFGLPSRGLSEFDRVVVLCGDGMEFGVLADAIRGVRYVVASELQAELPTLTGVRERFLRGVLPDGLIVLNGAALLGARELRIEQHVARQDGERRKEDTA